jgi:uncharacterized protein YqeY
MASLKEKIENDLKAAMKSKNMAALSALRLVISAVKNKEIELRGAGKLKAGDSLEDADVLKVLSTLAKQRQESMEMFRQGGRKDLLDKESSELKIIETYLPAKLSKDQLEAIVDEAIKEVGAASAKDMGKVMKAVMPKVVGQADGKLINEIVRNKLT